MRRNGSPSLPYRALIAVGLVIAAGAGACGDDRLDAEDIQAAERVMRAWAEAWEKHDGAAVCATLTQQMQDRYGAGREGCARGATRLSRKLPIKEPPAVRIREGESGSPLTGIMSTGESPFGGGSVTLVEHDGRWLLDDDLTCTFPSCD